MMASGVSSKVYGGWSSNAQRQEQWAGPQSVVMVGGQTLRNLVDSQLAVW